MLIKSHELYPYYLHYLETKKMNNGAKKLAEISESLFFDFKKKWQLQPGFKEKWENTLIIEKRDENIEKVLEKEEFELFFDDESIKTQKNKENWDGDFFDFQLIYIYFKLI